MARTQGYLEELVAEVRGGVGGPWWDKWVRTARARAGGKASPRKYAPASVYEEMALGAVTAEKLAGLADGDLKALHSRCHELMR